MRYTARVSGCSRWRRGPADWCRRALRWGAARPRWPARRCRATGRAHHRRTPGRPPPCSSTRRTVGAATKEYGELLGTAEAREFSAWGFDIHEWLACHLDRLPKAAPLALRVAVQHPLPPSATFSGSTSRRAPCWRRLSPSSSSSVTTDCAVVPAAPSRSSSPLLAGVVCERKLGAIAQVTRDVVASANLGCSLHLSAGGSTRCIRCRSFSRRCRARPCPGRARVRWRPARSGAARWGRWAPVGSRVRST